VRVSTTRRAWARWQAAAGLWQGWSVCPALLAPETVHITPSRSPRPAADHIAASLENTLREPGTAVVMDLDPVLGIYVAARLNHLRLAHAVLLLPRWPYRDAILPVDCLLDGLVRLAPRLVADDLPNVAFVLDGERQRAVPKRPSDDGRADNRYRLAVADLPNLAALQARGIRRIVRLSHTFPWRGPTGVDSVSASHLFPRGDPQWSAGEATTAKAPVA
jgi:hypothetical protein